jgi:predicted kinase
VKTLDEILASASEERRAALSDRLINIGRSVERVPAVIALIGLPASGKSTFTKAYMAANARSTVILSSDDLIEEIAREKGKTYSQVFPTIDMKELEGVMTQRQRTAVALGQDIIIDRTNMRAKSRRRWLSQVPRHYIRIGAVFEVPMAILHQRLFARKVATGKDIPKHVIYDMLKDYQEPTYDEFDIIVHPNEERADALSYC